jgi:hypothetical protein
MVLRILLQCFSKDLLVDLLLDFVGLFLCGLFRIQISGRKRALARVLSI